MPSSKTRLLTGLLAASLLGLAQPGLSAPVPAAGKSKSDAGANSMRLYRYKNADGVQVTGTTIKPEDARRGYQVVNMQGAVLETIPPEPTAEERARYEQTQKDKLTAAQQQERDKELMLRYSKLEEIHLAKQRKLSEIDNKIKMLNANISSLKQQVEVQQEQAATYERNGQPIPPALITKIDSLQQELKVSEGQVTSRQQELQDETARFDEEIKRFAELEQKHGQRGPGPAP